MLKIDAQIIRDTESYKLVMRVVTNNEIEVAHTKFIELSADVIESFVMLRNTFAVEFEHIEDVVSDKDAIKTVKEQNEKAEKALKASEVKEQNEKAEK
jgi:S-methylmethionine-dependent homocysteine/selenocysteine methylase